MQDQGDIIHWRRGLPLHGMVIIVGGHGAWREALQSEPTRVMPGFLPAGSLNQAGIELGQDGGIGGEPIYNWGMLKGGGGTDRHAVFSYGRYWCRGRCCGACAAGIEAPNWQMGLCLGTDRTVVQTRS